MKRVFFSFFILLALSGLSVKSQVITYDTIRVSPNDERNIHRNRRETTRMTNNSALRQKARPSKSGSTEEENPVFDKRKLRFGADFGLSIGRNYTNLGIGPQIGYQFSPYFMTGIGIKYYYTKARTFQYEIRSNLLGANMFGYFYPVKFIALFVQPELNYIWSDFSGRIVDQKFSDNGVVPALVVGGGFRLGRSHITLNYDIIQHEKSPHPEGIYLGVSAFF